VSAGSLPGGEVPPTTLDLLAALEAMVAESRRVPFTGTVAVNDDELLSLVDRIRLSLPDELVRAHTLLDERERILSQTEEEASRVRERAEAAARSLAERTQATARRAAEHTAEDAARLRERAEVDARKLVQEARARAEALVSEHSVLRAAEERATAMIEDAQAGAERVTAEAEAYVRQAEGYVRQVMSELEEHLGKVTAQVHNGLSALQRSTARPPAEGPTPGRRQR
jgi:cell division septum initiation protein DivIVA